ncbi:MAG: glycosyltransferase family 2 protein [Brevinematia bacterium]
MVETTSSTLIDVIEKMKAKNLLTDYELIFVDDGSIDSTFQKIICLNSKNPNIKCISFSKNYGLQAAVTAGLENSDGDFVVIIDCDLQDPPEVIEDMLLKMMETNCDVVYGKRRRRKENFLKKALILIFHRIFSKISNIKVPPDVGNFSLLTRRAVETILRFKEKSRYIPALRFFIGFKQEFIEYDRKDREIGKAKMNFKRLFKLAMDAIFSFSDYPIRFCIYIGSIGVLVFMVTGVYVILNKFVFGKAIPGWSSILLSIYFLGSIQLLFLGIVGEYIFRIYMEVQDRPLYIIDKKIGFNSDKKGIKE